MPHSGNTDYYHLDDSQWPLVLIRAGGEPQAEQILAELDTLKKRFSEDQCYVTVADVTDLNRRGRNLRRVTAQWTEANREQLERLFCAAAIVVRSPVMQVAAKAYLLFNPMIARAEVFADPELALIWAQSILLECNRSRAANES